MKPIIVRTIKAHEIDTVEIQWTLNDNSIFVRRYTVPPKNTREYKEEE
jgi:hypothetical protein